MGKTWEIEWWQMSERSKWVRNREENALGLLRVCRQIYAETALLPFKEGTFKCYYPADMSTWLMKRSRGRREAIKTLYFANMNRHNAWRAIRWTKQMKRLLSLLPGLKKIRVAHYGRGLGNGYGTLSLEDADEEERVFEARVGMPTKDIEVVFERDIW
jgi:hypothetical protein